MEFGSSASPGVASCLDIARGIASMAGHVFAIAGGPVTHIAELLGDGSDFDWAINEKMALESAVGMSAVGRRACVITKHNGLSIALDSLTNAAVHTLGAGLVIVVGDDLDASRSTCLNDSRSLARFASTPILEPTKREDVKEVMYAAVRLSEELRIPTIVRITSPVHAECGAERLSHSWTSHDSTRRVKTEIAHGLTKLGRHQRQRLHTLPAIQAEIDKSAYATSNCRNDCGNGIIAVGAAGRHTAAVRQCVLAVRSSWPLPKEVIAFADRHDRVLMVEEPLPFAEHLVREEMADRSRLFGRLTGHLPPEGPLSPALLQNSWTTTPRRWMEIAHKPRQTRLPRRYATLFEALGRLHAEGVFVAADVGSSVRLCYPPYSAADVALSLGSAVSVACGAARIGESAVGVIGDYALCHSGLESLLDAVIRSLPVLAVVLVNRVQAQTGGQPVPPVDVRQLADALQIKVVDDWNNQDLSAEAAHQRLLSLLNGTLPAVALVRDDA